MFRMSVPNAAPKSLKAENKILSTWRSFKKKLKFHIWDFDLLRNVSKKDEKIFLSKAALVQIDVTDLKNIVSRKTCQ